MHSLEGLLGWSVSTADGVSGRMDDVYYDDRTWTVRCLVVADIEKGTAARLVSPFLVDRVGGQPPQIDSRLVFLDETREQVRQTREFDRTTLRRGV